MGVKHSGVLSVAVRLWRAVTAPCSARSDGSLFGAPSIQRYRAFSLGVANSFSIVFSATSSTADAVTSYICMVVPRKDMVMT